MPTKHFKIGVASDIRKRLIGLQIGNPRKLQIIYQCEYPIEAMAREAEKMLHQHFAYYRLEGEWFAFTNYVQYCIDLFNQKGIFDTILDEEFRIKKISNDSLNLSLLTAPEKYHKTLKHLIRIVGRDLEENHFDAIDHLCKTLYTMRGRFIERMLHKRREIIGGQRG